MAVSTTAENCQVRFTTAMFVKECYPNRIMLGFNLRLHRLYCTENEQGGIDFFLSQSGSNWILIKVEVDKFKNRS